MSVIQGSGLGASSPGNIYQSHPKEKGNVERTLVPHGQKEVSYHFPPPLVVHPLLTVSNLLQDNLILLFLWCEASTLDKLLVDNFEESCQVQCQPTLPQKTINNYTSFLLCEKSLVFLRGVLGWVASCLLPNVQ